MRLALLWLLMCVLIASYGFAVETPEQNKKTIANRLTRVSFSFPSASPVFPNPVYVLPPQVELVSSVLRSDPGVEKIMNHVDFDLFFEKEGAFSLGPFVFKDKNSGSYSLPPVIVDVVSKETISTPARNKPLSGDLPPKFYTYKPYPRIYPNTPVYFILEIPGTFQSLDILWPGWHDVYSEKVEENTKPNGSHEIKYMVFFKREGIYSLKPIQFHMRKNNKDFYFSSSSLSFQVEPVPKSDGTPAAIVGNYDLRLTPYAGTNKDFVQVDVTYSGRGFLRMMPPPVLTVTPYADVLLKKSEVNFLAYFPEPRGKVDFRYIFFPPDDGYYRVELKPLQVFDPATGAFKNISAHSSVIKVMLPSNPSVSGKDEEFQKRIRIRKRPDYDLYALLTGVLLVTFFAIGLYMRRGGKIRKKAVPVHTLSTQDELADIQRSLLLYLKYFVQQDLITSPLSHIKDCLDKSSLELSLRSEIYEWLEDMFRFRYLKSLSPALDDQLRAKGLELLRKLREARSDNG